MPLIASTPLQSWVGLAAAFEPWGWMAQLVRMVQEWFGAHVGQDFLAEAALLFLTGGLAMLTIVVVLVLLGSLLTRQPSPVQLAARTDESLQLRTTPLNVAFHAPRPATPEPRPTSVPASHRLPLEDALERALREGMGEPRIVRHVPGLTRIRLYACPSCPNPARKDAAATPQCDYETRYFEKLFATVRNRPVDVREISCRRAGHPHCEFEVYR